MAVNYVKCYSRLNTIFTDDLSGFVGYFCFLVVFGDYCVIESELGVLSAVLFQSINVPVSKVLNRNFSIFFRYAVCYPFILGP